MPRSAVGPRGAYRAGLTGSSDRLRRTGREFGALLKWSRELPLIQFVGQGIEARLMRKRFVYDHLLCQYSKADQLRWAKRGRNSHVSSISAASHDDAADAGMVVPSVERIPMSTDIRLELRTEIHRSRVSRNTNIPQESRAVSGRNVHAPAKCNREVRKVATYASTRRLGRLRGQ
jgi:hypothetical protein